MEILQKIGAFVFLLLIAYVIISELAIFLLGDEKPRRVLLKIAMPIAALYGIFWFLLLEPNFVNWSFFARANYITFLAFYAITIGFSEAYSRKKENEKNK